MLGRHQGVIHYTVGQRKGLNIGGGDALYVVRLEADTRRVVVGPRAALGRQRVIVRDVNWLGDDATGGGEIRAAVKIRSTRPPAPATVTLHADGGATVTLDEPEEAVAPGQACVFYNGERVLGGGWVTRDSP
jgi:tRNA-specific 2-thiouridylase